MAVDEALLHAAARTALPTLRLYSWQQPTLSLGHFQDVTARQAHEPSLACPLVRRASGGGAILHDHELTYSIVLPQAASSLAAPDLYQLAHRSLIEVLTSRGVPCALHQDCSSSKAVSKSSVHEPFLCFQRRTCFDIVSCAQKIVGSAQRRRKGAVLQHGSILLATSECAPELPGVRELTGANIEIRELASAWMPALAEALKMTTYEGGLTEEERHLANEFAAHRFTPTAYATVG